MVSFKAKVNELSASFLTILFKKQGQRDRKNRILFSHWISVKRILRFFSQTAQNRVGTKGTGNIHENRPSAPLRGPPRQQSIKFKTSVVHSEREGEKKKTEKKTRELKKSRFFRAATQRKSFPRLSPVGLFLEG